MPKSRIIHGVEPKRNAHPWAVEIFTKLTTTIQGTKSVTISADCGGTLIGLKLILTAAHCVNFPNLPQGMKEEINHLLLGAHNISNMNENGQIRIDYSPPGDKVKSHPKYNGKDPFKGHDIALINLKNPVQTSPFIKIACLGYKAVSVGTELETVGWGKTEDSDTSDVIMMGKSKVIWFQEYRKLFNQFVKDNLRVIARLQDKTVAETKSYMDGVNKVKINLNSKKNIDITRIIFQMNHEDKMRLIFTYNETTTACVGDSGSGLIDKKNGKNIVVGVVAIVTGSCAANNPDTTAHTKLIKFRKWIELNTVDKSGQCFA